MDRDMEILLVILTSSILGLMRVLGFQHEAFQAVAHLWVGFLVGGWVFSTPKLLFRASVIVLSILEVVCFLAKFHNG